MDDKDNGIGTKGIDKDSEKNKKAAWFSKSSIIALCLLIICALGVWTYSLMAPKPEVVVTPSPTPVPSPTPTPTPMPTPTPTPKTELEDIIALREQYGTNDIIGYIEIPDTNISYPVAWYTDNEYYLNRDLYGNNDINGTVFMDFENSVYELSDNTVIYGHNMRSGVMFHNLRYYMDESYFKEHPRILFTTLYDRTEWDIFAFYKTTTDFYYIQTTFDTPNDFNVLLHQMKTKSHYDTGVDVNASDKIITLSTCANEGGVNRYVLNAKLVKINGEDVPNEKEINEADNETIEAGDEYVS